MSSKQVTIKDIAALAGVSFSTVSRCLNNSPLVAEKTREKVVTIAEELHFEFNASARGLITSKVGTVGIVLPEHYTQLHVNGYHSMLVNSLRTNLEMHDVDMMVTYQKNHYTGGNNIIRLVTRGKVDGLIILAEKLDKITLNFLEERQIPCVFGHYPPSDLTQHQDTVFTDHYVGGQLVAKHLLERGYASYTLLEVAEPHLEFELRAQGFCDTLEGRAEIKRFACQSHFVSSRRAVTDHMDEISSTRAVFCLNDLMAFGAIRALKDAGMEVPGDIAVVGYDDSEYGQCFSPALTTVHQPKELLAEKMCERLFEQIDHKQSGRPYEKRLTRVQPELVIREST